MADVLIELQQVGVNEDGRCILDNIHLRVNAGEIVTLIGPNGAGKTTLVRVVLGLQAFSGKRVLKPGINIGYMPQRLELNPQLPMTVKRFLALSGANEKQMIDCMSRVGAQGIAEHSLQAVSGGELQRVLLARALMQQPDLLVLDEPVQGVDVSGQAELYELIECIKREQGCGILMVSHDLHLVMAQTDNVVCINKHICCHGHPEKVSHDPAYLELFGKTAASNIALYTHHHDHEHDLQGNVVDSVDAEHKEGH